jgi:pyridinium-3,5-bisthiocarboxylic acid mononucleotide nickel chelatase
MKILWLEPIGGISGDMTLGALVDLGVPLEVLEASLSTLKLPGWRLRRRSRELMGIVATKIDVGVDDGHAREGNADGHGHDHGHAHEDHGHGHDHGHTHRTWRTIRDLIAASGLSSGAQALAQEAFERLAVAEGRVHGIDPEDVHFHEVGAIDAIVDICGMAAAVDHLGPGAVYAAPPPLGSGFVKAAHGRIPVPAPATVEILRGVPVAASETVGELTTPTGAAILATLAAGRVGPMPAMTLDRIGYGCGDASWPDRPNVLRATLGRLDESARAGFSPGEGEVPDVLVIDTNIDDMSPELVPPAIEALLEAGALDVTVAPVLMKKGRPGQLFSVLCRPADEAAIVRTLLKETPSLGVRIRGARRVEAERRIETVVTPYGEVRMKVGFLDGERLGASPEYEDCRARAAAHSVPTRTVQAAAVHAWMADRT